MCVLLLAVPLSAQTRRRSVCPLGTGCAQTSSGSPSGTIALAPNRAQSVVIHAVPWSDRSASVDASGVTWTLTIPAGALAFATDVTISPAAAQSSAEVPPARSGVVLEPSGLSFGVPAVLKAETADGTAVDVVSVDDSGTPTLAAPADGGGALLFHFSGGAAVPPTEVFVHTDESDAFLKALRLVQDNSRPLFPVPVPEVAADCTNRNHSTDTTAIARYQRLFMEPEATLIRKLTFRCSARKACMNPDPLPEELAARLLNGFNALIADSERQPDHGFKRVYIVVQLGMELASLFGSTGKDGLDAHIVEVKNAVAGWIDRISTPEIDKVRTQHDFKAIAPVDFANQQLRRLTGFSAVAAKLDAAIEDALHWQVHVDRSISHNNDEETFLVESTADVSVGRREHYDGTLAYLGGSGHNSKEQTDVKLIPPSDLTFQAGLVGFEPCDAAAGSVLFEVDKLEAHPENFLLTGKNVDSPVTIDFSVFTRIDAVFTGFAQPNGLVDLPLTFINQSPVSVDQTLKGGSNINGREGTATYHIKMTHTPQ
jgi:hypothetical protein